MYQPVNSTVSYQLFLSLLVVNFCMLNRGCSKSHMMEVVVLTELSKVLRLTTLDTDSDIALA